MEGDDPERAGGGPVAARTVTAEAAGCRDHAVMPRQRLSLLLAALACAIGALSAAAAAARPAPLFVPAPHGPYRLGDAPVAIMNGDFDPLGRGFDDYLVGYARGGRANLFYTPRERPRRLVLSSRFAAPTGPSAFAGWGDREFAILSSGSDQARVFVSNPFLQGKIEAGDTVPTGADPVAAVIEGFVYSSAESGETLQGPDLAVVNRGSDDLWMYDGDYRGRLRLVSKVPLGPEPTAAVTHECCVPVIYVATAGDDRVTLLEAFSEGEFRSRHSFRVGDRPSALTLADFVEGDYTDEEIAVANRGSDDVTILDDPNRGPDFESVGTYSVGDEPMAIAHLNVDDRGGVDLAVANAGSGDVSILLGDGRGGFRPGGTFDVGRRPVALTPTTFDPFFGPDLAVVNRGSDDLTFLLRHEVGRCQGRVARLRSGTPGPDVMRGREGPDEFHGRGGDDHVGGAFERDCLYGEGGDDELRGGRGDDVLIGGPGADLLQCEEGEDVAFADPGDRLVGCEVRR